MEMNRVLLKLSGEALAGEKKQGFDEKTVYDVAGQVKKILDKGIQLCVVIGGGNFWRGRTSENMDRVSRFNRHACNCYELYLYRRCFSCIWNQITYHDTICMRNNDRAVQP